MRLDERALLVKLTLGQWSGKKTDREATKATIESKHAQDGSGYFMKRLLGKDAMKQITKLLGAARATHNAMTLPWTDDGCRIITIEAYEAYTKAMREYRLTLREKVDEFLKDYDKLKKQAKQELGDLFNPDDYPDPKELDRKFYMDIEPMPVPISKDFRAKVSNDEAKIIAKDIEGRMNDRVNEAMKDVWRRIADVTERMADRLSSYDPGGPGKEASGVFRDSLVENVRDLAEVLPHLNLTNDKELTSVYKELKKELCKFDADDLRDDVNIRKQTAKKAKLINQKVAQYMA